MESITYNPNNNSVSWVDIILGEVHRTFLDDLNHHDVLKVPGKNERAGVYYLTDNDDEIFIAARYGILKANWKTGEIGDYLVKYSDHGAEKDRIRSNDGHVDPFGNAWIGTMTDFEHGKIVPEGSVYRIKQTNDLKYEVKEMIPNVLIPNGIAWQDNNKSLVWVDSLNFKLWKFDYVDGNLTSKREFFDTSKYFTDNLSPEPDGNCYTKDGHIYQCVFLTNKVLHLSPTGEVLEEFVFPASNLTSCYIGGPNMDQLFVTSAHHKLTDMDYKIDSLDVTGDLGGFLFKFDLGHSVNLQPKYHLQWK